MAIFLNIYIQHLNIKCITVRKFDAKKISMNNSDVMYWVIESNQTIDV